MSRDFVAASSEYIGGAAMVTAAPLTFACWTNLDSLAGTLMSLTDIGNASRQEFAGFISSSDFYAACLEDGTFGGSAAGGASVTVSTWQHVCAVYASATSRTSYVNGSAGSPNTNSRVPHTIDTFSFGADRSNIDFDYVDGRIAEGAVWNVALTASEIASLAKGFSPRRIRPQSLVFYAPLIRNLQDLRAALSLTASGTTVAAHPMIY